MVVAPRRAGLGLLSALVLVAALLAGVGAPAGGAPPGSQDATARGSSRQGSGVYIVQMLDMPVVAYQGDRAGLPATASRGGEHVNPNSAHVRRYQDFLNRTHTDALRGAGAGNAAKVYDYTFSFNGFAAVLTGAQAARLARQPNVVSVSPDERRFPLTDNTPVDLGLIGPNGEDGLWETGGPGGTAMKGEDVIIGVIDTGIWPEHPSFSDEADLGHDPPNVDRNLAYGPPPAHWHGRCVSGERFSQQDCNNKLIGARWFTRGLELAGGQHEGAYASPRDADGHGTHTASTAGGNGGVNPIIFGSELGVDTISGMAPRARIAAYKGCFGEAGCALSDLVASIDTAVSDGVDVINYSIGSDAPSQLAADADAVSFLFAAQAGVFVATSAGNAGPGAATVGSPADAPWITAAGASTHSRVFQNDVILGGGPTFHGGSVTQQVVTAPLVDGGEDCPDDLDPAEVTGAIVLCLRVTGIARIDHGAGVLAAGGVGMILYDPPQVNVTPTDNHLLPTSHVSGPDGAAIKAYIEGPGNATATITAGSAAERTTETEMAVFSSRGPNRAASDIIKPDVTAPGVQILAGNSPTPFLGAPGQLFQAIQGTSMSSPHVAGIGALLVGAHPDWTPAMVRSALTTTGSTDVFDEDGTTPADPFDFGGGYIAPVPANNPGLVYDLAGVASTLADHDEYLSFLCGNGDLNPTGATCTRVGVTDPSDLNLASMGINQLCGTQTITRTVRNVGSAPADYAVTYDEPVGVDVVASPEEFTIAPGATQTYTVTFSSVDGAVFDEWTFGALTWTDGSHNVRSPIAVKPVAICAPDEISGTGTSGTASYDVTFGYNGEFATAVHGLFPATVIHDTVVDDPDSDITSALESGVGVNVYTISVPEDPPTVTRHLRISLFDETVDGATDDIDLYLFPPGEDPFNNGEFSHVSGSGTSAEQIDVPAPEAGDWTLIVHGWETDGADAVFDLFYWLIGDPDAGNLTATPDTATATVGDQATVTLNWAGLTAATRYLGIVSYTNGGDEIGGTFVSIVT